MEVAEAQDLYLSQFERLTSTRGTADPSWLRALRQAALDRFRAQRFPTTRDEEFRATPVSAISERVFEAAFDGADPVVAIAEARAMYQVPGLTASELVFVNGRYSRELSSLRNLPDGVRVTTLAAALVNEPGLDRSAPQSAHQVRDAGLHGAQHGVPRAKRRSSSSPTT